MSWADDIDIDTDEDRDGYTGFDLASAAVIAFFLAAAVGYGVATLILRRMQ